MQLRWLIVISVLAIGCADNNLFSSLADDDSRQAKLEEAQQALDKGECQKAIDLFSELQADDPDSVDRRLDLSAAYMCQAGFNVTTFVSIAADVGSDEIPEDELFKAIVDRAVEFISPSWPDDLDKAEGFLSQPDVTPLMAYKNDADVGFSLAIVSLTKAALLVADILNFAEGVVSCIETAGSAAIEDCQITQDDALAVLNSLEDASGVLAAIPGVSPDVSDTVNTTLNDLDNIDGNLNNDITTGDVGNYLLQQGILDPDTAADPNLCVEGYRYDAVNNTYVVDPTVVCP